MVLLQKFRLAFIILLADIVTSQDEPNTLLQQRDPVPQGYDAKPWYPAPKGGWVSSWTNSYSKAQAVVANMTLAEKVNLTSGTGYFMVSFALVLQNRTEVLTFHRALASDKQEAPYGSAFLDSVSKILLSA